MASVSSLGSGSGLALEELLTKLMTAEQAPLTALATKVTSTNTRISSLGTLNSALAALQTAAQAMKTSIGQTAASKYSTFSASTSDATVATASTTTGAAAGTYKLTDVVLATAQQITKTNVTAPTVAGSLSIQVGSGTAVNVTLGENSTLSDVASAINSSSAGVTASIVTSGSDSYLTFTANNTGAANTITITGSDTTGGGSAWQTAFGYSSSATNSWTQKTAAADASLKIDDVAVTSASNTLTSISGLSINLLKAGTTTVTVTKDSTTSLTSALNTFVTAYNSANTTMGGLGAYNATTKKAGALQGNSTLRNAQTQVRSLLFSNPTGGSSPYQLLSDIGVSVAKDGSLSVDSTKLNKAITADFTTVASMVAKVGAAYDTALTGIVGTDGSIAAATKSANATIKDLEARKTAISTRLTKIEAIYRAQFTALDTLVAKMKTTQSYLTQQFATKTSS
ncbi:MAG: Flagellar hook-associated protein 2, N-terminal:Flagellar hook-associated 2, C-terminal [Proteobacteria bacterium]|nr:Flagellar hook-associated protein 2, N-terminal:Flagellar hook-associated 2, C-terminal [Pseudomonadota bacterium]